MTVTSGSRAGAVRLFVGSVFAVVFFAAGLAGGFAVAPAVAGAIRVQPVSLDLPEPARTGTLTLRNEGRTVVTVQTRIFRWAQDGGATDMLIPTRDVVVSPPSVRLPPGADYVLRVVRTARTPVAGEEAYRVLVDELPDPGKIKSGRVSLLIRQSIPIFFTGPDASRPRVSWSVSLSRGALVLKAENAGGRRLKISDLTVKDASGAVLVQGKGLAGYVLGGASRIWTLTPRRSAKVGSTVVLEATSDGERINVRAQVQNR